MQINYHSITNMVAPIATRWRCPVLSAPPESPSPGGGRPLKVDSVSGLAECIPHPAMDEPLGSRHGAARPCKELLVHRFVHGATSVLTIAERGWEEYITNTHY